MNRNYFEWNKNSAAVSAVFMFIAAIVRAIAYYGGEYDAFFTATQIILPFVTVIIFIFAALKQNLILSAAAVLLGVVFFIIKSLGFESVIHTVLCIMLYLLVLALYILTIFGIIKTKIPLILAFALPLAEHIIQDIIEIALGADISAYLPELSVLMIMASLLCVASGLRKKNCS